MAIAKPLHITSLDELHRRLPEMVRHQETHPRLAIAALANPLLALETLGYTIDPAIAREVALRTRFSGEDAGRLLTLERDVHAVLGDDFDIDDAAAVAPRLLRLVEPEAAKDVAKRAARAPAEVEAPAASLRAALGVAAPVAAVGRPRAADPLVPFRGLHPVIGRLVAYRTLEASRPRLASRAVFEALLAGKTAGPVTAARLRYKRAPERSAKER
jgi:hypothetical protein